MQVRVLLWALYLVTLSIDRVTVLSGEKKVLMTKCTNKGCSRKATHQIALLLRFARFPQQYRPVCKKHGKKKALDGYNLVRDDTL